MSFFFFWPVLTLKIGVKLALTGAVDDKIVPFTALADYLFEKCMEKNINIFGPLHVLRCDTSEEFLQQVVCPLSALQLVGI